MRTKSVNKNRRPKVAVVWFSVSLEANICLFMAHAPSDCAKCKSDGATNALNHPMHIHKQEICHAQNA
jgi:hypothetical protein